jgi:hypothetical protein
LSNINPYHSDTRDISLGSIPVDLGEFNKLLFSSRPVVVECPYSRWKNGDALMGLYAALRAAKFNRKIGVFADYGDADFLLDPSFYNALCRATDWKEVSKRLRLVRDGKQLDFTLADDWIFYTNWTEKRFEIDSTENAALDTLRFINDTNGFKDLETFTEPKYVGERFDYPKKIVILWDATNKEVYECLKRDCGKRFVFIDYTKEKELVDDWFDNNETMLDPTFDMKLMDTGLNLRNLFHYAATNHLYKLREYAKVLPEVVCKHFTNDELRDLGMSGCKYNWMIELNELREMHED